MLVAVSSKTGREPVIMVMVQPLHFELNGGVELKLTIKLFSRWMRSEGVDRLEEKEFIISVEVEVSDTEIVTSQVLGFEGV